MMGNVLRLFQLDAQGSELQRAQFQAFCGHIPLLYAILFCNTVAITATTFDPRSLLKTALVPILISAIIVSRAVWWMRQKDMDKLSDEEISLHLVRTCVVAVVLTLAFNAWVIWIYQDANAFARSNLTFFLALSQVSTVFCLMTSRIAAMLVAVVSTVSFVLYFSWVDGGQLLPQSMVLCCVCVGMAVVTHILSDKRVAALASQHHIHRTMSRAYPATLFFSIGPGMASTSKVRS